jgi:phosphoglycerate-specific signal transduction histidine kinase
MLIARQKQNENIAEYVLYMYQIEDLIRAYDFQLDAIIDNYVRPQLPDNSFIEQYRDWYRDLISQMKSQRIEKQGHLHNTQDVLVELSYLHNTLINLTNDHKYKTLVETATPFIDEFKDRSNLKDKNHIEILFHALYMKLLMRLQGKDISAETEEAFDSMRILLAYLARAYGQMKSGSMDFLNN